MEFSSTQAGYTDLPCSRESNGLIGLRPYISQIGDVLDRMAGGEAQEVCPQVLEGGEVISLEAELSQPELEHS